MSTDWWWGALTGVIAAYTLSTLLLVLTAFAAVHHMHHTPMAEERTWTDDIESFLHEHNHRDTP